jgi:hypothetical protein
VAVETVAAAVDADGVVRRRVGRTDSVVARACARLRSLAGTLSA